MIKLLQQQQHPRINVLYQHPRRRNVNSIRQPGDPAPSDQEVRIAAKQRIPTQASTTLGPKVHPHIHTHSHPRVCIPMHQSHQPQRILSGFLESEGLNPAFDSRLLLIRAGDVEENPGPKLPLLKSHPVRRNQLPTVLNSRMPRTEPR